VKPKDLVPTRETCERLKAAGFGQETVFCWVVGMYLPPEVWFNPNGKPQATYVFAAPTAAELMEALGVDGWNSVEMSAHRTMQGGPLYDAEEALALLWLKVNEKGEVRP